MNWSETNNWLRKCSEEEVKHALEEEVAAHKRPTFVVRLHQRYNLLRATREREELMAQVRE